MKTLVILITALISSIAIAQSCDCKTELDFYYTSAQELESFKTQFKGKQKQPFTAKYLELQNSITGRETAVECYKIINQLAAMIKDEHAILMMNGFDYGEAGFGKTNQNITGLRASTYFKNLPRVELDLDSLQTALANRERHQIEGIYATGEYKFAVVASGLDEFQSVIIESPNDLWSPGMIHGFYTRIEGDRFSATFSKLDHTIWYNIRYEKIANGRFFISGLLKGSVPTQYDEIAGDAPSFEYKKLNAQTDYIRVGSFSRMSKNVKQSKELLSRIKGNLKGTNLIIDLRDNGGGADKVSKPYRKLAKKFARRGKVYILVNKYSGSNAEITTEFLSRRDNATVLGHDTTGALAYGSNYGTMITSPSGQFMFTKTDMDLSHLLPYEEKGFPVDIQLDLDREWLPQVMEIIVNDSL